MRQPAFDRTRVVSAPGGAPLPSSTSRGGWTLGAAFAFCLLGSSIALTSRPAAWPPQNLRDTGLYSDWESKTIGPENLPFAPQYPLWTDGAAKSRWIYLPAGTWIDGSDPDVWRFPVGTRIWKEFRFGRRVETRLIEHTDAGWQFASYAWAEDESDASLAPELGIARSFEVRTGVWHAIPSRTDCLACHEGSASRVLGFSALQLSSDRDPAAPHAEPVPPGGVNLAALVALGLLRGVPQSLVTTPPRIDAPSAAARAARGYLHANCGICHNGAGPLSSLDFSLAYSLGSPGEAPAFLTSLSRPSRFKVPGGTGEEERVRAGEPDRSVLVARMSSRHPLVQMPPLGTKLVDEEAVGLIRRWIEQDLKRTAPTRTSKEDRR